MQEGNTVYFDAPKLQEAITTIQEGRIFEIRLLHRYNPTLTASGIFENANDVIEALKNFKPYRGKAEDYNAYMTINQLNEACDSMLQYNKFYENVSTVSDNMIDRYKYLFIDLDPERVAKVSSNAEELHAAHELGVKIINFTRKIGVYDPAVALSGNGYHIFYKIDIEKNNDNTNAIALVLKELDKTFSNEMVHVDTGNFNPARVCKLHGSRAMKGSNRPHRPWRMSKFIYIPDSWEKINNDLALDVILEGCDYFAKKVQQ